AQRRMATENMLLKEELAQRRGAPQIVGDDPKLKQVSVTLHRAAATDTTVLIEGESGTGKELFARALHALSPRADGPFVAINCAAIPETLLETDLFGHEKGAITGAANRKSGKFELAHRGTLFLDEIGDLPTALQAKILRARAAELHRARGDSHRGRHDPAPPPEPVVSHHAGSRAVGGRESVDEDRSDGNARRCDAPHRRGSGAPHDRSSAQGSRGQSRP